MEVRTGLRCDTIPEESTGRPDPGSEILLLTVDMGGGKSGQIVVREMDDPQSLACEFVKKYRLPSEVVGVITHQIQVSVAGLEANRTTERTGGDRYAAEQDRKQAVFDRLQRRPKSHRAVKSVSDCVEVHNSVGSWVSDGYANPGDKQYAQGWKRKESQAKEWLQKHKAKVAEENKEMTFAPKLGERKERTKSVGRREDLLIVKGRKSQDWVERQREELLAQETSECTFTPQINPESHRLTNRLHRSSSVTLFSELHADAHRRRQRQDMMADSFLQANCPFHPSLISKQLFQSASHAFDRLSDPKSRGDLTERRRKEQEDRWEEQQLFKPKVGRSPKKPRNPDKVPVGDYLYQMRAGNHHKQKPDRLKPEITCESKDVSTRLLQRKKHTRYLDLFSSLNPDENHEIVFSRIVPTAVSQELLTLLSPLLDELNSLKVTLNFEEFADAMDALVKTLLPEQKAKLLGYAKKDLPEPVEAPYRPQINSYTGSARFQKRFQSSLYSRTVAEKRLLEERLKAEKSRRDREELEQCSFQPRTLPYELPID